MLPAFLGRFMPSQRVQTVSKERLQPCVVDGASDVVQFWKKVADTLADEQETASPRNVVDNQTRQPTHSSVVLRKST